jgi:hypothetical protein
MGPYEDMSPEEVAKIKAERDAYFEAKRARKEANRVGRLESIRQAQCAFCEAAIALPLHPGCLPKYLKFREIIIKAYEEEKAQATQVSGVPARQP